MAPEGAKYTMFSGALIDILRQGVPRIETPLSLEQIGAQIKERIRELYPDDAVRPEVHSPDQRVEDIALVPVFPNAAMRPRRLKDEVDGLARDLGSVREDIRHLSLQVKQIADAVTPLSSLTSRVESLENRPAESGSTSDTLTFPNRFERERAILETAPPYVVESVFQWRRSRLLAWCGC
jgi:hypothetical protein